MSAGVMAQRTYTMNNVQDKKASVITEQAVKSNPTNFSKEDAYWYPASIGSPCATIDSTKIYIYSNKTYVTGSNVYDDRAFAQRYTRTNAIPVKGIGALLFFVDQNHGVDNLTAKMYSASSTGIGNELASKSFTSSVLTPKQLAEYQFMFSAPTSSKDFAVAISVPGLVIEEREGTKYIVNNLVAIASTPQYCASGGNSFSLSANEDGTYGWAQISTALGSDFDLFAFPIVDKKDLIGLSNIDLNELSYIYPNPAKNEVIIASSLEMNKVEIFNMVGQRVYEANVSGITAKVNVSNFNAGSYVAKIYTDSGIATKKIIVQ